MTRFPPRGLSLQLLNWHSQTCRNSGGYNALRNVFHFCSCFKSDTLTVSQRDGFSGWSQISHKMLLKCLLYYNISTGVKTDEINFIFLFTPSNPHEYSAHTYQGGVLTERNNLYLMDAIKIVLKKCPCFIDWLYQIECPAAHSSPISILRQSAGSIHAEMTLLPVQENRVINPGAAGQEL